MWIKRTGKIINLRTGLVIATTEHPTGTFNVEIIFLSGDSDVIYAVNNPTDQLKFFNLIWAHLLSSETGLCLDTQT